MYCSILPSWHNNRVPHGENRPENELPDETGNGHEREDRKRPQESGHADGGNGSRKRRFDANLCWNEKTTANNRERGKNSMVVPQRQGKTTSDENTASDDDLLNLDAPTTGASAVLPEKAINLREKARTIRSRAEMKAKLENVKRERQILVHRMVAAQHHATASEERILEGLVPKWLQPSVQYDPMM